MYLQTYNNNVGLLNNYSTNVCRMCASSSSSAIISSYPTNVSEIIVLLNSQHWIKISQILVATGLSFSHFEEKFSLIKLLASILGQCTGSRMYTMTRES